MSPSDTSATLPRVLPWVLALLVSLTGIAFLEHTRRDADAALRAELDLTAALIGNRTEAWFQDRLGVLGHFADRRGASSPEADAAFSSEAEALQRRVAGFLAINWIDADGHIRLVTPQAANQAALGKDLRANSFAHVRRAISKALDQGQAARTGFISFYQGGQGFSVYLPVANDRGGSGVVNGVFRIDQVVAGMLPDDGLSERFHLQLTDTDGETVFLDADARVADAAWQVQRKLSVLDMPLQLVLTSRTAPALSLSSPGYAVWMGFVIALGVAIGVLASAWLSRLGAVQRREAHIRLLMDSTVEGLVGLDLAGQCTFANAAAANHLGFSSAAGLRGEQVLDRLVRPGQRRSLAPGSAAGDLLAAARAGDGGAGRARVLRIDGTELDVAWTAVPVRTGGRVSGVLVTLEDISGELDVASRAGRMERLVDQVQELVFVMDDDLVVTWANAAGVERLETSEDELVGTPAGQWFDPSQRDELSSMIRPLVDREGSWRGEVLLRSASGAEVPSEVSAVLHDEGERRYYSAVCRDLSTQRQLEAERNALERQFQQAQKSESLGLLAGGIAHDFNNLLMGILGNASLVLDGLPEDSRLREQVQAVETATQRAAELTRQLLAYSGRGRFTLQTLPLGGLVQEMVGLLRASIPRQVALEVRCAPDAETAVLADATQLRQLVMNLITNGADAVQGDGSVQMVVERRILDPRTLTGMVHGQPGPPGEYLVLEVRDSGCGMTPEVLQRIFDPFFTTKADGRGLGLSAALGIIRGHDALLHLQSAPDEGSCFQVLFPVAEARFGPQSTPVEQMAPAVASHPAPAQRRGLVLVVDDEAPVRDFLVAALASMGLDCIAAESGAEAVELAAEHGDRLGLLLLDQTMPGMSGSATWQTISAAGCRAQAVLMSGYDREQIEGSLGQLGFAGFLHKPFRVTELRNIVDRALGRAAA